MPAKRAASRAKRRGVGDGTGHEEVPPPRAGKVGGGLRNAPLVEQMAAVREGARCGRGWWPCAATPQQGRAHGHRERRGTRTRPKASRSVAAWQGRELSGGRRSRMARVARGHAPHPPALGAQA